MDNLIKIDNNSGVVFITDSDFSNTDKSFEYLLGFQPSLGGIILLEEKIYIFLDGRYFGNTKNINKDLIRKKIGNKKMKINFLTLEKGDNKLLDSIISILLKINIVYLENNIASKYYEYIKRNTQNKEIILIENYFGYKRILKQNDEVVNLQKAIVIIDKTFNYIKYLLNKGDLIGKTELQVRSIIISKIMEFGGTGESFDTIVAFAENSSIPHHSTGETIINTGVLLIDMGALYNGYCSDFTRTFWVGEKNEEYYKFLNIKDIVKKAHNEAFKRAESGIRGKELDLIAREIIENEGYGEYYIHSLGHGVGLDIHEFPRISTKSKDNIIDGMVFTIEPGIYLPGQFGVRLEDIVFMKNGKGEKYTTVEL